MFKIISTCKGGGYMYCRTAPIHPKANSKGLYPLHRVLVENQIGRLLLEGEEVHHVDGDKSNNNIRNLKVLTKSEHAKLHRPKTNKNKYKCPNCAKVFELSECVYNIRMRRNKNNMVFCSRSCGASV